MGTKAIPIYIPAKRPRIGTIGKNHIQSSSNLSGTALFVVCSESDTFLKNYNIEILRNHAYTDFPTEQTDCLANAGQHLAGQRKAELL